MLKVFFEDTTLPLTHIKRTAHYLPDYKVSLFNMNLRALQKDWQPCNRSVLMHLVYILSYSSFNSR